MVEYLDPRARHAFHSIACSREVQQQAPDSIVLLLLFSGLVFGFSILIVVAMCICCNYDYGSSSKGPWGCGLSLDALTFVAIEVAVIMFIRGRRRVPCIFPEIDSFRDYTI